MSTPRKSYQTPTEWYRCLNAGVAAVRHPERLRQFERPGLTRIIFYHLPSFEDATGWAVYRQRGDEAYEVQRVIWHQARDRSRMAKLTMAESVRESAEPTLSETCVPLDAAWVKASFAEFSGILVPLHTERPMGLDGESFGIRKPDEFDVEWWCEGPEKWQELVRWRQRCVGHFNQIMGEEGAADE